MFNPEERARLRSDLLEHAAGDPRISGAAITGSAAAGREDRWSDIDLAFGIHNADELPRILGDWTAHMYGRHGALHHLDVKSGAWTYRVFLLASTLQVDLAFVHAEDFRALRPTFRLVAGKANEPRHISPPEAAQLIGLGWLYALHARSCIARGRLWQAKYMISGVRDHALALACLRRGLPTSEGRGFDSLPKEVAAQFEGAIVRRLEPEELLRAFRAVVSGLLEEIHAADAELAEQLRGALMELTELPL